MDEGRCRPGQPTDTPRHPTEPDQGADYPYRSGCYVDDDHTPSQGSEGRAHYLATLPPYALLEVVGRTQDIEIVENWAWEGNQDIPGGPTIWG